MFRAPGLVNYRVCDDLYNYYTNSKWLYNNPLITVLVQDMQFATSLHQSVCNLKIESLLAIASLF